MKTRVFIARVFKWLEKLSDQTESEADDAVLETLEKPLGYLPITVALYVITLYLPLSGTPAYHLKVSRVLSRITLR